MAPRRRDLPVSMANTSGQGCPSYRVYRDKDVPPTGYIGQRMARLRKTPQRNDLRDGVSYFDAFGRRDIVVSMSSARRDLWSRCSRSAGALGCHTRIRAGFTRDGSRTVFFHRSAGGLGCHTRIRAGFTRDIHRHDVCFPHCSL